MKSRLRALALGAAIALPLTTLAAPTAVLYGDARFAGIHSGLTQDEVRSIAGAPNTVIVQSPERTEWTYNYVDSWGMRSVYAVKFGENGRVTSTSEMRVSF
jgi:hypothetical protein